MSISSINISIDSEIRDQAQDVFASLGLDIDAAIDIFLRQTIRQRSFPFEVSTLVMPERKPLKLGCMEGKIWMADDFDSPMEEFEEDEKTVPIELMFGCMKDKIWISDDFDAPMEEFEEYM